jgi:hypothetical protein
MNSSKLVVFGDRGEVIAAFRAALEMHGRNDRRGIAFGRSELEKWKGATKRDVVRHFVERQGEDKGARREDSISLFRLPEVACRTLSGARRQNDRGSNHDFRLAPSTRHGIATTTGFYREANDLILQQAGLDNIFAVKVSSGEASHALLPS